MQRRRATAKGLLVAVLSVAAITGAIFGLREAVPVVSTGVLYMLAVLLVSSYWGAALGILTAVVSTLAFNWFHIPPTGRFTIADSENWVALSVFFIAAVVVSALADAERSRSLEAETRRREADLAAGLAHLLLGGSQPADSLREAARRIAEALELPDATLELRWEDGDQRRIAIPLVADGSRVGTLIVPRSTQAEQVDQLRDRVAPSLSALLAAALRRQRLEGELVETEALRRSDVLKTALLRAVSHDLRSPLTAIRTAASAVASRTVSGEERDELAGVIAGESERLSRLVDNLLDLSKLEAGTADPRLDWCSIDELVHAAAEHTQDARVDVDLPEDLPLVRVDSAQIERALANLLDNAVRHSDGQPVAVGAVATDGRVLLRVTDRGPGIASEEMARIFEPFYRSPGEQPGGSGLGLAIAKGFVEANGGRLRAQSPPNEGATFTIDLPVEDRAE